MAKKGIWNTVGAVAFLVGILIAVVIGIFGTDIAYSGYMVIALIIIGLIVGLLNITSSEATPFLMSGAVLIIASYFGKDVLNPIPVLANILQALLVLFVPSTIVVAVRNVFSIARR